MNGLPGAEALDDAGDWLQGATRLCSPNCDDRPPGCSVDLVVVHGISLPPGRFGTGRVTELFLNCLDWEADECFQEIRGLKVSSHVLIERTGALVQFVPFRRRAWHAGESSFQGRSRCNDFSVGIELEGADDVPYHATQYRRLASVISALMARYPAIGLDRIVGHCHVSPGRKTDPGPVFDWRALGQLLGAAPGWQPGAAQS